MSAADDPELIERMRREQREIIARGRAEDRAAGVDRITPLLREAERMRQQPARTGAPHAPVQNDEPVERTPALDWADLATQTPPERDWAEESWFGMGHVTLMAGQGGIGKTAVGQAWGSCLAIRRSYLDWVPTERRVLMWACEDDAAELWRRQAAIAAWLGVPLSDFAGRLYVHSYCGAQVELAGLVDQRRLIATPMMRELREQIGDYGADVVILDNIARLFAGNENDRHQVTSFIAMLTAAATPTNAAVLLLGHPGKAQGSEYSGSTAWEGAVRSRLYLGATLPDAAADSEDDATPDDTVRYLCRRKANYSARDWRRIRYVNGVMVPELPPEATGKPANLNPEYAADVVMRAIRKLATMDVYGTASKASPNFLPRLAKQYQLLENVDERHFAAAMREAQKDGRLTLKVVGKYANRTPKHGLTIVDGHDEASQ